MRGAGKGGNAVSQGSRGRFTRGEIFWRVWAVITVACVFAGLVVGGAETDRCRRTAFETNACGVALVIAPILGLLIGGLVGWVLGHLAARLPGDREGEAPPIFPPRPPER